MTALESGAMPLDLEAFLHFITREPWWEYKRLDPRRANTLGASEIGQVMSGDIAKIMRLYRVKIGEEPAEDLSQEWPIIRGTVLEGPILHRYALKSGTILTRQQEFILHPHHDWFSCTLDAWDPNLKIPVDAKCPGGREPLEVVIERSQSQMQSQMAITGAPQAALVIAFSNDEPIIEFLERDDAYISELLERGAQFMQYVRNKIPPIDMPAIAPPVPPSKTYDMTGNNLWAASADAWIASKPMAEICKDAEQTLKGIMPEDAKKAYGHSVIITRDRVGRKSLRRDK